MAADFIPMDKNKDLPRAMARGIGLVIEGVEVLASARAAFEKQRDGNGDEASHYDLAATQGGYSAGDYADANAACRASFLELDSLLSKLNTDDSVTHVRTAIYQFAAKHGIIV